MNERDLRILEHAIAYTEKLAEGTDPLHNVSIGIKLSHRAQSTEIEKHVYIEYGRI